MEFRRIENLPPYVFSIINGLKIEARRAGADVVDLGFGNPDIPSPQIAVDKLAEAAQNPKNHRYSLSRGLPKLREAIAGYYKNKWDVDLDPELEITNTIGSKEGFSHLMWVLLDHDDAAIVPSPSYPIHIYGPLFAGADLRQVPMKFLADPDQREHFADDFMDSLQTAWDVGWPKPRVLVISFPHNPTGATVDLAFMQRVVDFCREHEMIVVHDFAYADVGFDGHQPPSILQADGAKECAVELYSMTKSFSMAGWRSAFLLGNAEVVQALVKLKSYLDYGMFQPVQIASTVTINERPDFPDEIRATYESRCDALLDGLGRIGWDIPKPGGSMFVWAPIPEPYAEMDSVEFCSLMVRDADVALSPGVGFGPGGEGFVRFALIENEKRIQQAVRNLRPRSPETRLTLAARPAPARRWADDSHDRHGPEMAEAIGAVTVPAVVTIVVRVWMPDRPGALGQVASRIGAVRGDVLSIEILEQGAGRAIDELTVSLPSADLMPLLSAEIDAVDGVSVENIRIVDPDRTDASMSALAVGAAIAECAPEERLEVMVAGIQRFAETTWVAVLDDGERIAGTGAAPDLGWLTVFLAGSEHLDELDDSAPSDLLWGSMTLSGYTVAAGRGENPIHERERVRFSLLLRLADALIVAGPPA